VSGDDSPLATAGLSLLLPDLLPDEAVRAGISADGEEPTSRNPQDNRDRGALQGTRRDALTFSRKGVCSPGVGRSSPPVEAGIMLQLDDPAIAENWDMINPEPSVEDYKKFSMVRIEALNHAIRDLPKDRIRFNLC
jgi:hypothetical protein